MTSLHSRDWTRGHGIPFDRSLLEPDDPITDLACHIRGRLDTLAATIAHHGNEERAR